MQVRISYRYPPSLEPIELGNPVGHGVNRGVDPLSLFPYWNLPGPCSILLKMMG